MKQISRKIALLIGAGLLGFSSIATAATDTAATAQKQLRIVNDATPTLSFQVDKDCSTVLGNLQTKNTKTVSFAEACNDKRAICRVYVYTQPDCEGTAAAEFGFNTNKGILDIIGRGLSIAAKTREAGYNTLTLSDNKKQH